LSPHYPFLLHTHHPLTSLLFQLYTVPAPSNPWHCSNRNTPKHEKGHETHSPRTTLPTTFPTVPFSATFTS
jgi:hypothetical protein